MPAKEEESKETKRYRALVPHIEKRDGRLAPFSFEKISKSRKFTSDEWTSIPLTHDDQVFEFKTNAIYLLIERELDI